ncbi:formate transporter FocA [Psychromonas ossibalaenae]|uniref:formate transporter FocA n=1 Tax=Psychromonas ossibalaenae TaxID=444922 RepID=UPI000688BE3D|nr:formate transporter FocA [Psychromonas ossibalaenae]
MSSNMHYPVRLVNNDQQKPPEANSVIAQVEQYGLKKVQKSVSKSFALAVFAGAFIAIAFVFYITVTTGASGAPWGLVRLSGGLAFSVGLILVVVCGGELFTSTVLSTVAWAQGLFSTGQLLKCWLRVYLGNLAGAALMLALIVTAQMHLLDGGAWGINALQIAQHKLHHSWAQAFALGILCNILVCLGIWMTFSCKDALAKSMLLVLPVAMFVSSGFEHSIANMFMVPLGIAINAVSEPQFYINHGLSAADFSDLTWSNFIFHNLIPVTLGNIVGGGLLVGLGYWLIDGGSKGKDNNKDNSNNNNIFETNNQLTKLGETHIMKNTLNSLTVSQIMDKEPLVFLQNKCIYQSLALLTDHEIDAAPVIDDKQQLIGFISQQDILRLLWSEEYSTDLTYKVEDAMQTEILTVDAHQPVATLLEFMVVDKERLFPVNDGGMLTSRSYQSYEQRLKSASAQRPSIYPVINNGLMCGVISRRQMAALVVNQYLPDDKVEAQVA